LFSRVCFWQLPLPFLLNALTIITEFIGISLAALPVPLVLAGLRWVDRYEPEPQGLLAFAFFWGQLGTQS